MSETKSESGGDAARRGVGFPSMGLQEAVDAVVLAGHHGPDHTQDAFATYLGHKTANSGAFRGKLASLRDWGLIARGDRDRVVLSGLAQELVLAAPEHYAAKRLLLTAFESCRVFGMLYNDSAKSVPMDFTRLRTTALMRYGVVSNQANKFVDSFVKSAVFAGLAESDGNTVTLLPRESAFASSDTSEGATSTPEVVAEEGQPLGGEMTASQVGARVAASEPAIPVALRQQWPIDGGEIEFVIRTSEALPPSIYALVAEMAEVAERMKAKLAGPYVEIVSDRPPAAYRSPGPETE